MSLKHLSLGALCLVALSFSLFKIGEQSLWIDEGYSINAAQGVLAHGLPVLGSGELYLKGVASTYTMAFSMALFGFNPLAPWSARLPSVLFFVATVIAVYQFSKRVFENNTIALLSAGIITFLSWEVAWARQARGYMGMQFFCVLSLLFFFRWFKEREHRYLYSGTVLLFISILFHPSSAILILPIMGAVILDVLLKRESKIFPAALASGIILVSAVFFYEYLPIKFTFKYTSAYFNALRENVLGISLLMLPSLLLLISDKKNRKRIIFLLLTIAIPVGVLSIYRYSVQQRYLFPLIPAIALLASYTTVRFSEIIFSKRANVIVVGSVLTVLVANFSYFAFYPTVVTHVEQRSPQPDFKNAYNYIRQNSEKGDVVISAYTHLSKIYLDDRGFWLPISLTSNKDEVTRNTINNSDYYTGAPKITYSSELESMLKTNSGFVIIDGLARSRLGRKVMEIILSVNPEVVFHKGEKLDEIWVYRFIKK